MMLRGRLIRLAGLMLEGVDIGGPLAMRLFHKSWWADKSNAVVDLGPEKGRGNLRCSGVQYPE